MLKKFVLVYQQDQNFAWLRTASHLLTWSEPVLLYRVGAIDQATGAPKKLFYPSIVVTGEDPNSIDRDLIFSASLGPLRVR